MQDQNKIIDIRVKFWGNVLRRLNEKEIPPYKFVKEAEFENPGDLRSFCIGKIDFPFVRLYKVAVALGCKPSDLLIDIGL